MKVAKITFVGCAVAAVKRSAMTRLMKVIF